MLDLLHVRIIFQFSIDLDLESKFSYQDIEVHHGVQLFMYKPLPVTAAGRAYTRYSELVEEDITIERIGHTNWFVLVKNLLYI